MKYFQSTLINGNHKNQGHTSDYGHVVMSSDGASMPASTKTISNAASATIHFERMSLNQLEKHRLEMLLYCTLGSLEEII